MSKKTKVWFITAAIWIVVGCAAFAGGMYLLDFDFSNLNTAKFEAKTYSIGEDFNSISINSQTAKITFVPSTDGKCKVECFEQEKVSYSVAVRNGTLKVDIVDNRAWYDYIGIFLEDRDLTVYLPKEQYVALTVETDTGDVMIPSNFSFETVTVEGDTADITCNSLVSASIDLETDTGNLEIYNVSAGNVEVSTDTGRIDLTNVSCKNLNAESDTGSIILDNVIASENFTIENDTGNVNFEKCDAANITVETSTGNVIGTLLSDKIFITKTSTGHIAVPETTAGGKCDIRTSTGNIEITIG